MPEGEIKWPDEREIQYCANLIHARHPLLTHGFAFSDGLHLPLAAPGEPEMENAYYNGWCSNHFTSNVFTFAPTGVIFHCVLNAPGSYSCNASLQTTT